MRALIDRSLIGESGNRDVGLDLTFMTHNEPTGAGGLADNGEIQPPFAKDRLGLCFRAWAQHHQHALLALGEHHLIGGHSRFALGHMVEVQLDADAALARHLDRGGGEPRRAHILDGDDGVLLHQLQAGLEQQLFGERIAHLHGRTLLGGGVVELG